jgi:SAM-dependent methyltransferase
MLHANSPGPLTSKEELDILDARQFVAAVESDSNRSLFHRVEKIREISKMHRLLVKYEEYFANASSILEIGAGTCWASYLVKRFYPKTRVTASDLTPVCRIQKEMWAAFFETEIDSVLECPGYDVPVADASFDLVFCFESAHHFGKHDRTLKELFRIVRPGGTVLYLSESSCSVFLYKVAHARVNRPGHGYGVSEDVLIHKKIRSLAEAIGFELQIDFDPHLINRGELESIYYWVLKRLPFLWPYLPCTANFVMRRP